MSSENERFQCGYRPQNARPAFVIDEGNYFVSDLRCPIINKIGGNSDRIIGFGPSAGYLGDSQRSFHITPITADYLRPWSLTSRPTLKGDTRDTRHPGTLTLLPQTKFPPKCHISSTQPSSSQPLPPLFPLYRSAGDAITTRSARSNLGMRTLTSARRLERHSRLTEVISEVLCRNDS